MGAAGNDLDIVHDEKGGRNWEFHPGNWVTWILCDFPGGLPEACRCYSCHGDPALCHCVVTDVFTVCFCELDPTLGPDDFRAHSSLGSLLGEWLTEEEEV